MKLENPQLSFIITKQITLEILTQIIPSLSNLMFCNPMTLSGPSSNTRQWLLELGCSVRTFNKDKDENELGF